MLDQVFDCALRGHALVAPKGSGVDVASATFGGFLRFNPERKWDHACTFGKAGWSGSPARVDGPTSSYERPGRPHPSLSSGGLTRLRTLIGQLTAITERFVQAFEAGSAGGVVEEAGAYADAMEALGNAARAPIVEERLQRIGELAKRFSGSAKPCGAGGGDVAVAFFVDQVSADRFETACRRRRPSSYRSVMGCSGRQSLRTLTLLAGGGDPMLIELYIFSLVLSAILLVASLLVEITRLTSLQTTRLIPIPHHQAR